MDPDNILRDNPGSAVFSRHAENLAREGRIGEALDVLRRGIEANPYHASGHSVLAEILFQLDSEEEAVERLLSSVRLDPQSPRDLFRLAMFQRDHEQENAGVLLDAARTYEPAFDETADFWIIHVSDEQKEAVRNAATPPDADADMVPDAPQEDFLMANNPEFVPVQEQEHEGFIVIEAEGPEEDDFESLLASLGASESAPESTAPESSADSPSSETDVPSSMDVTFPDASTSDAGDGALSNEGEMEQGEYPRPLNDRPVDSAETEDAPSLENAGWNVFDEPVVQQVEDEEHDFFDVISEYRDVEKEEDLGNIFTELDQNRNPDVPSSEGGGIPDVRDITDSEPNEDFDSGGGSEDSGVPEQSGGDGVAVPTLSIDEEEEYNLANFGFDSPDAGELPVLSPEERSELLALTGGRPDDDEGYGLSGLTLDDIEDAPGAENAGQDGVRTDADAEIVPTEDPIHDVTDNSLSLSAGGSYFDLLSAWDAPVAAPAAKSAGTSSNEVPEPVPEPPKYDILPIEDILPMEPVGVDMDVPSTERPSPESESAGETVPDPEDPVGTPLTREQSALIRDFLDDDVPDIPDVSVKPSPGQGVTDAGEEPPVVTLSDDSSVQYSSLDAALASYGFSIPEANESAAPEVLPAAGTLAGESLDDLISAYRIVLDSPARPVRPAPPVFPAPSDPSSPVMPVPTVNVSPAVAVEPISSVVPVLPAEPLPTVAFDAMVSPVSQTPPVTPPPVKIAPVPASQAPAVHSAGRGGSYTATMAEIYTSQGLVARAIEIYEALLAESPDNERYQSRLVELKRIYEQNTDAS